MTLAVVLVSDSSYYLLPDYINDRISGFRTANNPAASVQFSSVQDGVYALGKAHMNLIQMVPLLFL